MEAPLYSISIYSYLFLPKNKQSKTVHTAGTALLGWTNMRLLVLSQKSDEQVRLSHTTVHHQRISRYIKKLLISLDTFLYRPVFESAATQQIFRYLVRLSYRYILIKKRRLMLGLLSLSLGRSYSIKQGPALHRQFQIYK